MKQGLETLHKIKHAPDSLRLRHGNAGADTTGQHCCCADPLAQPREGNFCTFWKAVSWSSEREESHFSFNTGRQGTGFCLVPKLYFHQCSEYRNKVFKDFNGLEGELKVSSFLSTETSAESIFVCSQTTAPCLHTPHRIPGKAVGQK